MIWVAHRTERVSRAGSPKRDRRPVIVCLGALLLLLFFNPTSGFSAVGCQLNDPEGDLRRFFPELTEFTIGYVSFELQNPKGQQLLERRLKDKLDRVYETIDVPYSMYSVRSKGRVVGHVFGANQRGTYSNIQVIAITDHNFQLQQVYLQKLRSPLYPKFQSKAFLTALGQVPFERYPDFVDCYRDGRCDGVPIKDPSGGQELGDFRAILRAMSKLYHLHQLLLHPEVGALSKTIPALSGRLQNYWRPDPQLTQKGPLREVDYVDGVALRGQLEGNERVVVWNTDGRARVLPVKLLDQHPVVEIEYGLDKQVVIWSVNSQTATIHNRVIDGRPYAFTPSGNILFETATVIDQKAQSEWSPALGRCVYGQERGAKMPVIAGVSVLTWAQAKRSFLDIVVVLPREGYRSADALSGTLAAWFRDGRAKEYSWLVRGDRDLRLPVSRARRGIVAQDSGLLVVRQGQAVLAFESTLEGATLRFRRSRAGPMFVDDIQTGSRWNAVSGHCVRGKYAGKKLTPAVVLHLPTKSVRAFFPKARLLRTR